MPTLKDKFIKSLPCGIDKVKKTSHIPLSKEELDILQAMREKITTEAKLKNCREDEIVSTEHFLFFNLKTKNHLRDIKKFWIKICKKSEVKNATIHDLRYTFASLLVSNPVSLEIIGKLVGHTNS